MDIKDVALLVMERFREANGYSELDNESLFKAIYHYLNHIYQKQMYMTKNRLAEDERRGIFPDAKKYESEYLKVEDYVLAQAMKLAAADRSEI